MQVDVKIDSTVDEMKILVIADKEGHTVDTFVDYIRDYERKQVTKLMAYKGDTAYLINISDILRIYAGNQKVFVETQQNEYIVRYRLYELEELLEKKTFLRISNSEIVNTNQILNIDLSIVGRFCIRFPGNIQTYVSRRYVPKIKKSLGI